MRVIIASVTLIVLAPALGAAVAQAQTSVTHQITREPVETIVTQGPNGVAVTRRILSPEPGISTYLPPPPAYPTVATQAVESEDYVEAAALPRRATTTARTGGQAPAHARTAAGREHSVHTTTRTVTVPPLSDQALALSPAQRQAIYRGVVEREYYPAPVVAGPPVVAQTEPYPPPLRGYPPGGYPPGGYPLRAIDAAGERDYAYDPYHDDYRPTYRPAYRPAPFAIGARIPQSVPLYAVPEPVALRIPAAAPYSYAFVDNRVFLVDPATDVIVAEIAP
jgi:Protein of unknown function (DUF1236)